MRVTSMQSLYNSSDLESHVDQIDVKKNNLDLINNWNNQGYNTVYKKECYDFYHEGEIPCDKDYIYVDIYNDFLKPYILYFYCDLQNDFFCRISYFLDKKSPEEFKKELSVDNYSVSLNSSKFTDEYQTQIPILDRLVTKSRIRLVYLEAFIKAPDYKHLCKQCSSKIINEMLYQEKDCLLVNESEVKNKVNLIINEIIQ